MKDRKKTKYINFIIISITILIVVGLGIEEYKEKNMEKKQAKYQTNNVSMMYRENKKDEEKEKETNESLIKEEIKQAERYPKEEIIKEYRGYDVLAKLEIPAIELQTYILKNYSTQALNISVTKFWGANPNEIGNFCVAGHNFKNNNMFRNLKKLQIGNRFTISDNNIGKVEYEIYNIYTVLPEDVKCLSQKTNGKREVTLITCTSDSKMRIIVKAREWKE